MFTGKILGRSFGREATSHSNTTPSSKQEEGLVVRTVASIIVRRFHTREHHLILSTTLTSLV